MAIACGKDSRARRHDSDWQVRLTVRMYSTSLLGKLNGFSRSVSLQNFDAYRARESLATRESVVTPEGTLLDYPDLELRRNPPNVEIDNRTHPTETIITIDSANRPGTLVEVVQCFTELNLAVRGAQISSDGGWFVDVFNVEESTGGKVIDHRKLERIREVLKIEYECERRLAQRSSCDERGRIQTVLEVTGKDRVGLLHDATKIIARAGLDIKSLAAWTQYNRGALVIAAVTDNGPLECPQRTKLLKKDLLAILDSTGHVDVQKVKGLIHHERRLHRMLLREAKEWETTFYSSLDGTEYVHSDKNNGIDAAPEVTISGWKRLNYWRVAIYCTDRTKLLFDTLCTLADSGYEVYHATVVTHEEEGTAFQEFYIRPRFGEIEFNEEKAKTLRHLLISSILRRAPHGLKVHILTMDQAGLLARVTEVFKTGGLRVTRAVVKCLSADQGDCCNHAVHTFSLQTEQGTAPDSAEVVRLLSAHGGALDSRLTEERIPPRSHALQESFAFNISD